jgi:hypothetical protein
MPLALLAPALLLASIAGTAALLGAAIVWARNRQRRATARRQAIAHGAERKPPTD